MRIRKTYSTIKLDVETIERLRRIAEQNHRSMSRQVAHWTEQAEREQAERERPETEPAPAL
jgi:predicted transcriptional regulator